MTPPFDTLWDVNDCEIAVRAAESMCARLKCDVVILFDLSTKLAKDHCGDYLEIIRYQPRWDD